MRSKCSKGEILRKSYTTKTGKKVKSNCIEAQSQSGEKSSLYIKKFRSKQLKTHKKAREIFKGKYSSKCKKGEILREGYKRKEYTKILSDGTTKKIKSKWISPSCIKSATGKSSKGPKLITITNDYELKDYGYENVKKLSSTNRQKALTKAIKYIKPISLFRKLIALSTLQKNIDPKLHKIFYKDAYFVRDNLWKK